MFSMVLNLVWADQIFKTDWQVKFFGLSSQVGKGGEELVAQKHFLELSSHQSIKLLLRPGGYNTKRMVSKATPSSLWHHLDLDVILCLNQALSSVDPTRKYCLRCIQEIRFTPSLHRDYGYCNGKFSEFFLVYFSGSTVIQTYEAYILHPTSQANLFLTEALFKLKANKHFLSKDWGAEAYQRLEDSLEESLDTVAKASLFDIKHASDKEWFSVTEAGILKKYHTICRRIFLQIKRTIAILEDIVNKDPCAKLNLGLQEHLNPHLLCHGLVTTEPPLPCPCGIH